MDTTTESSDETSLCTSNEFPDVNAYFNGIGVYGAVAVGLTGVALLTLLALWATTLRAVLRGRADVKTSTALIITLYPVVGALSFCALVVPRSNPLTEAVTQVVIMLAMHQVFSLFLVYCGGETELMRRIELGVLESRMPPYFSWRCCVIPRPKITEELMRRLDVQVLQLPVVQVITSFIMLVVWAEDEELYYATYTYFTMLGIPSLVCGIWGIMTSLQVGEWAAGSGAAGLRLSWKYRVVQFVLLFTKMQGTLVRTLPTYFVLPCYPPISATTYLNLICNSLVVFVVALLALWARSLFLAPLPENCFSKSVQEVKVIPSIKITMTLGTKKCPDEGLDNNTFIHET